MYGIRVCQTFIISHFFGVIFSEINSLYIFGFSIYTVFAGKQLVPPVIFSTNLQRNINNLRHGGKINHNTRLPNINQNSI